ncbi:sulfatase [Fulvivirgaceae bacterium BMA10]|uniref:Sulfatase n=1 Tax=Splendidivirga corallicola TaxID=3051826 RepID=A0ABT8KXT0_9BACT|nr:sulfatase [Fulvivirgaceae bacterium BMA10]
MQKLEGKIYSIFALSAILILLSNCSGERQEKIKEQRPNIVFIMSDDHASRAISCYDGTLNQTPNIDRIASEGAIFTNSFVGNSICGPSRATMITGKFSHKNGFLANYRSKFDGSQQTLPKLLKANGYNTAIVGKWHLGTTPTGFDYWNVFPDQGDYYNPDFIDNGDTVRLNGYATNLVTNLAINWLNEKRNPDQPFMLFVHHKAPHRNWMPDTAKLDMYDGHEFPLPFNFKGDFSDRGKASAEADMGIWKTMSWSHDMKFTDYPTEWEHYKPDGEWHAKRYPQVELGRMTSAQRALWDDYYESRNAEVKEGLKSGATSLEEHIQWRYQRYMHDYLATISSVDDNVGRLLDYLEANGLDDNTIVVYTSDQGFYLGENGWFDKRFMYEQTLRTPFVMKYPGQIKPGTKVDKFIMNIDYMPTLLSYAGVGVPQDIQGRSFHTLLNEQPVSDWRNSIYYHYYMFPGTHSVKRHFGVRNERYKLIRFYHDIDEWELYDLQEDPNELKNVYDDPNYQGIVAEMKEVLRANQEQYEDSYELAMDYLENNRW